MVEKSFGEGNTGKHVSVIDTNVESKRDAMDKETFRKDKAMKSKSAGHVGSSNVNSGL